MYFSYSKNPLATKRSTKTDSERVTTREGFFKATEDRTREREHSRATFIEQNRKRALIEIEREREKKPFSLPFFSPRARKERSFEFKKYSRENDVNERDGVEGNR